MLPVIFIALLIALPVPSHAAPAGKSEEWSTEKEIYVPMRDGVRLSTDVMLPKGAEGPLPTILIRSPYDKDHLEWPNGKSWYESFLSHGYALVLQSERGRNYSEGTYERYLQGASTDGYDTIEWITKQPWSNGKVGTFGCSSTGEQQWPMANSQHPGHAAMVPGASGTAIGSVPGNDTQGAVYRGGIPLVGFWAWWYHDMATTERLMLPPDSTQEQRIRLRNTFPLLPKSWFYSIGIDGVDISNPKNDIDALLMQLPSKDALRSLGGALNPFDDFITWTPGDARWKDVELAAAGFNSRTPALLLNNWHDIGAVEMTRMFAYLQDQKTPNQYLIMGPGPHCSFKWGNEKLERFKFGDLEIGDARYDAENDGYKNLVMRWFDHFVKGEPTDVVDMPKVQLFVMGKGWVSGDRWPLAGTAFVKYYLGSRVGKSLSESRQWLSLKQQASADRDSYLYDPARPVPTRGGGCCSEAMAVDQRELEMRRDVLSYATEVLEKGVTVVGPIEVVLYVSSSAKDTDFMVKLVDVYPDGKAINLTDDGFRVRYRDGYDKKLLMSSGNVYEIRLKNMVTSNYFPPGHRIRLDVTSSNFPTYERNLNTGGNNFDETKWVTAENSIHHTSKHPSHVVLPILEEVAN
ncbi:MAG: CocE/NonD family hydrolase [Steroidobacteraceae bacterium]